VRLFLGAAKHDSFLSPLSFSLNAPSPFLQKFFNDVTSLFSVFKTSPDEVGIVADACRPALYISPLRTWLYVLATFEANRKFCLSAWTFPTTNNRVPRASLRCVSPPDLA